VPQRLRWAAVAATLARDLAKLTAARVEARPSLALVLGGAAVGLLAVLFHEIASRPAELVLFSGQSSLGAVTAETTAGVLVALVVAKGLAYAISLAVGFRGGPIFPAVAIGVMVGVIASLALPDFALAPGVVAGLAGGAAASLKLPFFGAPGRAPRRAHRNGHGADCCYRRPYWLARGAASRAAGSPPHIATWWMTMMLSAKIASDQNG
jgi:hypothetical protein